MAKILIADDNITLVEGLGVYLGRDYDVHTAHDGQKAVDEYKRLQPDLLITDFDMPYKNGLSVAKEVTDYDPDAKVIIHTGTDDVSKEHALAAGALALVRKGNITKLEETVSELLSK